MIFPAVLNLQIVRGCTFEALEFQMLADDEITPINITGWNFAAEVRKMPGDTVVVDLAPAITDAPNGVVRLPAIDDETTMTYATGGFQWDLLGEDGSDNRQQIVRGRFLIIDPITDSG